MITGLLTRLAERSRVYNYVVLGWTYAIIILTKFVEESKNSILFRNTFVFRKMVSKIFILLKSIVKT